MSRYYRSRDDWYRDRSLYLPSHRRILPPISGGSGSPTFGGGYFEEIGENTVTAGGAANTKGTWVQMLASTPRKYDGVYLFAQTPNAVCAVDVGIGGAGSEVVLIPNWISMSGSGNTNGVEHLAYFPVQIASGTRVSMRAQSTSGGASCYCGVYGSIGGFLGVEPSSLVDVYGVTTSGNTAGTTLTAGGGAYTYGAYSQIVASTTRTLRRFLVAFANPSQGAVNKYGIQLAIGAGGSEVPIFPAGTGELNVGVPTANVLVPPYFGPVPVSIPAGQRIACKVLASNAGATLQIALYGLVA